MSSTLRSNSDHTRALHSFSSSIQRHEDNMATGSYHSGVVSSYHSSVTDDDLEEARQRLLAHQYDQEEPEDVPRDQLPPENLYQGGSRATANGAPRVVLAEPPINDNHSRTSRTSRYGSVSTYQSVQKRAPNVKRYRLPLLILLGFDWGLVVFLSIICFVLLKVHNPTEIINYWDLDIQAGFFDLVIIATVRTVLNILAYPLLGWVTRITMAFTTVVSACYVPIKTYYLLKDEKNTDDTIYLIALLMLVFVCFVIPWFVAFFFEFKYLPAEKSRLHIPSWWSIKPWVWPIAYVIRDQVVETPTLPEHPTTLPISPAPPRRGMFMSGSTVSLDFRTPMGSSRTSPVPVVDRFADDELPPIREEPPLSELATPECDQNISPEDQRFKRESMAALEGLIEITRNNDGWTLDKTVNDIKCYTKQVEGHKVFKADGIIETSAQHLWSILYPGNLTPDWNPQCVLIETVHRVDQATDVVYTVSAGTGPVTSRDFVSVRRIAYRDGAYYSSSKSTVTEIKPEQSGKVRGENGPNGYVVIPVSSNRSQFIWVLNCNLKGWLPQTIVDQALSSALLGGYQQLQVYIRDHPANRNQS